LAAALPLPVPAAFRVPAAVAAAGRRALEVPVAKRGPAVAVAPA
jgi:hypothetical protein